MSSGQKRTFSTFAFYILHTFQAWRGFDFHLFRSRSNTLSNASLNNGVGPQNSAISITEGVKKLLNEGEEFESRMQYKESTIFYNKRKTIVCVR